MSETCMYYSFILRAEIAKFFFEKVRKVLTDQTPTTRPKLEFPETSVFIVLAYNFLE